MALLTMDAYCGSLEAAKINEGFVVASRGLNFLMVSKSPVSATTVVKVLSNSKLDTSSDILISKNLSTSEPIIFKNKSACIFCLLCRPVTIVKK